MCSFGIALLAAVCATWLCAMNPSFAQETVTGGGTLNITEIEVHERTNRGKINACEIEYKVWFEDHLYKKGAPVALIGAVSLLWNDPKRQPVLALKVRGRDFISNQFVPFDISYAFFKTATVSYAGKEGGSFPCEGDGACVAYAALEHPDLMEAIVSTSFSIIFLRKNGTTDIVVPMNLMRYTPRKMLTFSECVVKIISEIQKTLR